jgi:hypothetical protein
VKNSCYKSVPIRVIRGLKTNPITIYQSQKNAKQTQFFRHRRNHNLRYKKDLRNAQPDRTAQNKPNQTQHAQRNTRMAQRTNDS